MSEIERIDELEDFLIANPDQAVRELESLVSAGDPDAMYVLGIAYYDGDDVKPDSMKCVELLQQASKLGHLKATHDLGCFHYYGYRLPEEFHSLTKAAEILAISAEAGYTPSMSFLGKMYELGEGVEKDTNAARKLYERAAELGDELGKEYLVSLGGA